MIAIIKHTQVFYSNQICLIQNRYFKISNASFEKRKKSKVLKAWMETISIYFMIFLPREMSVIATKKAITKTSKGEEN